MASLGDEVGTDGVLKCPSVAWDFGDGPALIQDRDCSDDERRAFSIRHTYGAPGAFEATARILGADLAASAPVQILVQGATPTPVPEGVLGFPPAVVTSRAADSEKGAGASGGEPDATATALAAVPAARAALELDESPPIADLPADVLVLMDEPGVPAPGGSAWLWLVGANNGAVTAEPVVFPSARGQSVLSRFDGSASGVVAMVTGGRQLSALMPDGQTRPLGGSSEGEFTGLLLSRGGNVLAYSWRGDGFGVQRPGDLGSVGIIAVTEAESGATDSSAAGDGEPTSDALTSDATTSDATTSDALTSLLDDSALEQVEPLAWNRDGSRMLVRLPLGQAAVLDIGTGDVERLPVRAGAEGGWLSVGGTDGESVVWLAGPGLKLLTLGDTLQQTTLLDDASVTSVQQADDGSLMAVVGQGRERQLVRFDLARDNLVPLPVGEPFALESGETALPAPNGTGVLVFGPSGARYLDHRGREQWLLHAPVRQAEWSAVAPPG